MLLSQAAVRVEHFALQPDGAWRYQEHGPGERLTLASGASISVDAIYEDALEVEGD